MTLVLWKAPWVADADDAAQLLRPYYERGDDSEFQPSDDLAKIADELLRRFPEAEDGPWADFPPEQTERLLHLSIRWGAGDAVIDAIVELARAHQLVLYDPQGPEVYLPTDPVYSGPVPAPAFRDYGKILLMGVAAFAVFWVGWRIDVPILNWLLMIVGGFFLSVILFLLGILIFGSRVADRSTSKAGGSPRSGGA